MLSVELNFYKCRCKEKIIHSTDLTPNPIQLILKHNPEGLPD